MRIVKIEIECFGRLRHFSIEPAEGLTVIEGENESGKSTLLAFLRFALYGFPRRGGADGEERDKRLTRDGRMAAGALTVSLDEGTYRIVRRAYLRGSGVRESLVEELAVLRLPEGEPVALEGKSPGEYFLGLPAELFESSICSVQSGADRVCASGVGAAMSELLFAGEHSFSAREATARLAQAQRELLHLKGRGGRIAELEDRLCELEGVIGHAREERFRLAALRAQLEEGERALAQERERLGEVTAALEGAEIDRTLALFDERAAASENERRCAQALERAQSESGGLPMDPTFTQRVGGLLRGLLDRRAELARIAGEREAQASIAPVVTKKGGRGGVFLAVCLWVLALAAGAAGLWLTAFLLPCMVGAGLLAAGALVATVVTWRSGAKQKAVQAQRDAWREAERLRLCELERRWSEAQGAANDLAARLYAELEPLGQGALSLDPDGLTAYLGRVSAYQAEHSTAHAAAVGERERARGVVQMLTRRLEGVDEAALRAKRRTLPATAETQETLRAQQSDLRAEITEMERELVHSRREEAALAATLGDPVQVEQALEQTRAELATARRRLSAVRLAREAMESAEQELRRTVTPRLAQEAGALFAELTEGAHGPLHLSPYFGMTIEEEGIPRPLSHFSEGCRDLAYLCLRLALLHMLSAEPLPLLLDEALTGLDDRRAAALLFALLRHCRTGGQCLLFTCHSREASMLEGTPGVKRCILQGGTL